MSDKLVQPNFHYMDVVLSLENKKRWHLALTTNFCSRVLLSLFNQVLTKNGKATQFCPALGLKPLADFSPSQFVINIDQHCLTNIDQAILSNLVKDKSLGEVIKFGSVEGIAKSLKTNLKRGISGDPEDILDRKEAFGANTYHKAPARSLLHFVYEAFKDPTIVILLICAAFSIGFGVREKGVQKGWYDGGSIFVAVFLVVSVSSISNFRQGKQFEKLSEISSNISVEVVRDARPKAISIFEVVVGDIISLKIGDQVPADGLFVEGHALVVDESSMTGESEHIEVNKDGNPFLFSGTKVVDGCAKMLVTSVGMGTTWGEMMSTVSTNRSNEQTPLQARLSKLTSLIGKVGLSVAFLVLVALLVRYFTGNMVNKDRSNSFGGSKTNPNDVINSVVRIIAIAVTIIVVAIPEGLPLAVTLTLAYSMRKMMADQAMVRKLSACETMGSTTTICTDKTGTLTMNQMKVARFCLGKTFMEAEDIPAVAPEVVDLLYQGISFNTCGSVYWSGISFEFSGSPTEKAILSWSVQDLKMDIERVKQDFAVLVVEIFSSEKKRSGVLVKNAQDNTVQAHWKGAAEMILAMCSHYYDVRGNVVNLDNSAKLEFTEMIQCMATNSLRCIGFACKQVLGTKQDKEEIVEKIPDSNMILLGFVGLKDPCRSGAKEAVATCQKAGINVKMITGDNVFTAKAIATECGILSPNQEMDDGSVVEGRAFRAYTDHERLEKVDKIRVLARSSPFDKLLMVQCLRKKGHVVAVTGDGTNDAPALKEADVGLSMGIQGTQVAKESSDIVILDDNFASVVTVLKWGRCVYNNIQKFVQFQLTVNVAALVINFVAAISAGEVPLTAVQLLWVNLIMDTLGALALATEDPTPELMGRMPVGRSDPLITNVMWRNLLAQALYQISVLLTLQFRGQSVFEKANNTMIFNTFVLSQVFNEFNARELEKKNVFKGLWGNKVFVAVIGVTVALQVVMVEVLREFAGTRRLNLGQWGICVGIAAVTWPIGWAVKFVPVPERPLFEFK